MNFHAKTNSTPKPDALPRQNSQRQFSYVREHSTPKPRRRQHLLDGVIFTAPRLNSVLGGRTNFHAETSLHAETAKKDLLPTLPPHPHPNLHTATPPSAKPAQRGATGPCTSTPKPCLASAARGRALPTQPQSRCVQPPANGKGVQYTIHPIPGLSMLPLFTSNEQRQSCSPVFDRRSQIPQIRRFNFLLL